MNALDRMKPAHQLALFGVVSGVFTTLVRWEAFVVRDTSVLPGLFFGAVLAYALWRWETKRWLVLAGVLIGIVIAWVAAWNSAVLTHDYFDRTLRWPKPATWITLGLLGGFVGSTLPRRHFICSAAHSGRVATGCA